MTFIKNSLIVSKKIKQVIVRDLFKSPVINYFADNYKKNVLISYITKPFRKGIDYSHTNSVEVLEIAKIFRSLEFNVDIADYDYEGSLDYDKYELVFGFGEPFETSFLKRRRKITSVFYGTGMHINIQNRNTTARLRDVYEKKGKWLVNSARLVEKTWAVQASSSDAAIVLGNKTSLESFKDFFAGDLFGVQPSIYKIHDYKEIIKSRNFSEAKKHYLWFGSSGMIHRSVDILLEIFIKNSGLNLHICGPVDNEPEFKALYNNELYNTPNIKTYGFIDIKSKLFEELLRKCAFVIYPSCSEGGGPSVLNVCGNGGVIPIITKEVSIDIGDFGILINNYDFESIERSISESQNLSEAELNTRSGVSGSYAVAHTLENFSRQVKIHLETIINKYMVNNA